MSAQIEKIALFIDGANLYATAKSLGFDIDYKRLLREFQSRGYLVRAFYYTAVIEDQEYSSIRPLIDWLDYNGYTVVTKATKEFVDQTGRRKVKGNMDIELAVDAMEIAPHIDQMVLFSGDGDFRSLVEAVQRRGVRVVVVSTISTQPPMVADELRRQADQFVDIIELQSKIGRDPTERPVREPREPREAARAAAYAAIPTAQHRARRGRSRSRRRVRRRLTAHGTRKRPARRRRKSGRDCPRCPRLVAFRQAWREREPEWFNAPVDSFGPRDARLLDRRPCARAARRQPHRTAVHRRLRRRSALRDAEGIRLRQGHYGQRRRRPGAASIAASPTRCAACRRRTSRRRRKSRPAATSSRPTDRRDEQAARRRRPWPHRAREHSSCAQARAAGGTSLRPRRHAMRWTR